jgi:hypothetical protein
LEQQHLVVVMVVHLLERIAEAVVVELVAQVALVV